MKNRLKKYRVDAGLTQKKIAVSVGVTQPNYHRWEVGQVSIPEEKLVKLAEVLGVSEEMLLGTYAPIEAVRYDRDAPESEQYYGEVAIHFCGGGDPILLSISEEAHSHLYRKLQLDREFLTVESLSNQTVIIRSKAISDIYFSSDAYDDFGPEGEDYTDTSTMLLPDSRDWEIIEAIACDGVGLEDFAESGIERIEELLTLTTDEEFEKLVKDGHLDQEEVESAKLEEQRKIDRVFEIATRVVYQLSTGKKRSVFADAKSVYDAFWELIDWEDAYEREIIRFPVEGYHRTIFINPDAIDFISVPTHQFAEGSLEAHADMIVDVDDRKKPASARRKKSSHED